MCRTLRLWNRPASNAHPPALTGQQGAAGEANFLDDDLGDEAQYISSYEKAHPLEVPKALLKQNEWALLKAIGVVEDDKAGKRRGGKALKDGGQAGGGGGGFGDAPTDSPGSLGSKLESMGKELLTVSSDVLPLEPIWPLEPLQETP